MSKPVGRMSPGEIGRVLILGLGLAVLLVGSLGQDLQAQESGDADQAARDAWDVVFMEGVRVGQVHTTVAPVKDGAGNPLYRVNVEMDLRFKRGEDQVQIGFQFGTIETPDGQVLRLETRTRNGATLINTLGDAARDRQTLRLQLKVGDRVQEQIIAWGEDVRGPYAIEQSLAREPLQPGQSRTIKTFVPDLNQVVSLTLSASQPEETEIAGGAVRELIKVTSEARDSTGKRRAELDQVQWVNSSGQVLKTENSSMGMVTYRTTKRAALAGAEAPGQFDLLSNSIIRIRPAIANAERSSVARFRIGLGDGDLTEHFPNDQRQSLRLGSSASGGILTVQASGPDRGPIARDLDDPSAYLSSNNLITSDSPAIQRLARRIIDDQRSTWDRVRAIQQWVNQNLTEKNFEAVFAPADQVVQQRSGDCTEHSVLVAALCRAAAIPARVVVGLVYRREIDGFGFHMWNEALVNGRWVAVDASFPETQVDAVHIKIDTSSLAGVSPFETFLPVAKIFGKLTIEPIEVR